MRVTDALLFSGFTIALAACGTTTADRTASGAGIGAVLVLR
jgi:hypothetical protein